MTLGCWRSFTRSQSFQGDFTSSRRTRPLRAMSISSTFAKGKLTFLYTLALIALYYLLIFFMFVTPVCLACLLLSFVYFAPINPFTVLSGYTHRHRTTLLSPLFQNKQIWLLQRGLWTSRTPQTARLSDSTRKTHPRQAHPNYRPHRVWCPRPLLRQLGLRRRHPRRCRRCI